MQTYSSKYLLLLLVFCVLVLLISIVGVSFAINYLDGYENVSTKSDKNLFIMYENNKNTLNLIDIRDNSISLNDDRYKIDFSVISDSSINYDIGLVLSNLNCYSLNSIKVGLLDNNKNVLIGKNRDGSISGIALSDLKKNKTNNNEFYLFSDKIINFNNIKNYSLIAYVDKKINHKKELKNNKCLNNENIKLKILTDE